MTSPHLLQVETGNTGLFPQLSPCPKEPPVEGSKGFKASKAIGRYILKNTPPRSDDLDYKSLSALNMVAQSLLSGRGPMKGRLADSVDPHSAGDPMLGYHRLVCELQVRLLPIAHELSLPNMQMIDWCAMADIRERLNDLTVELQQWDVRLEPIHHLEHLVAEVIRNFRVTASKHV